MWYTMQRLPNTLLPPARVLHVVLPVVRTLPVVESYFVRTMIWLVFGTTVPDSTMVLRIRSVSDPIQIQYKTYVPESSIT